MSLKTTQKSKSMTFKLNSVEKEILFCLKIKNGKCKSSIPLTKDAFVNMLKNQADMNRLFAQSIDLRKINSLTKKALNSLVNRKLIERKDSDLNWITYNITPLGNKEITKRLIIIKEERKGKNES